MSAASAPPLPPPIRPLHGSGERKTVYLGRRWVSLLLMTFFLLLAWGGVRRFHDLFAYGPDAHADGVAMLVNAFALGACAFAAAVAMMNAALGFPRLIVTPRGLTKRSLFRTTNVGWDSLSGFHIEPLKDGWVVSAQADVIGPNASPRLRRGKAKLFTIRRTYRVPIETILAEIHDCQTETLGAPAPLPRAASALPAREYGIAGFRIPRMTLGLLAVMMAAFVAEHRLGVVPETAPLTPDGLTLYAFGGVSRDAVLGHGEMLRLFSSTFLHLGMAHLVGNAAALLLVGWTLERLAGRSWLLGVFIVSGIAGAVAGLVAYPALTLVGASGGIAGLFAALAVLSFRLPAGRKRTYLILRMTLVAIVMFVPWKATGGINVGHAAHLGGALAGAALGILLLSTWSESSRLPRFRRAGLAVGTGGVALALLGIPMSLRLSREYVPLVQNCATADPDKRIQSCTTLLDGGPGIRFIALLNRGTAYAAKEQYDLAIVDLDRTIALMPGSAEAFLSRGYAYLREGLHDQSIADFSKAIELNQKLAVAYLARGGAYLDKGLLDRTIADEDQAIALDPKLANAYVIRGLAYSRNDASDGAIADYTKAIALSQGNADAYFKRGAEYIRTNRLDKAIADSTKVLELRPADSGAYNNRAWALHLKGENALGLPDAEKAVTLAPRSASALETRAEFYENLGRRREAIGDYRAALAIDGSMQLARDGMRRLGADPWQQ